MAHRNYLYLQFHRLTAKFGPFSTSVPASCVLPTGLRWISSSAMVKGEKHCETCPGCLSSAMGSQRSIQGYLKLLPLQEYRYF